MPKKKPATGKKSETLDEPKIDLDDKDGDDLEVSDEELEELNLDDDDSDDE